MQINRTQLVGWFMALCFITCALPQVVKTYFTQDVSGISIEFWYIWGAGESLGILYVFLDHRDLKRENPKARFQYPLLANYTFCLLLILIEVVMYYSYL